MAITNTPNEVVHQAYKSDKRSWFALKHTHLSSYQPGYEHPDLVVPITGNTTVKLNMSRYLQSAPTVTPLFDSMRVNFRVFFAPQRLYTRGLYGNNFEEIDNIENIQLPTMRFSYPVTEDAGVIIPRGSLLNRLGYPACCLYDNGDGSVIAVPLDSSHWYQRAGFEYDSQEVVSAYDGTLDPTWNLTPIVAYFDIWNHYIRNPYVEDVPVATSFDSNLQATDFSFIPAQSLVNAVLGVRGVVTDQVGEVFPPENYILGQNADEFLNDEDMTFAGLVPLGLARTGMLFEDVAALNDRISPIGMLPTNFGEHYQTMFYDDDEINSLNSIVIETDGDGNPTVEGLRLGKSVWNRTLRTILRGRKYTDWIDVQFGSKLKISDHPIFVGSDSMLISFQDVINQSAQGDVPLGKASGAGARGGKNADGDRTIVFTAQEPGYLMVLVDFVPEVSYSDVVPRWLEYETMSSFPMPAYSGRTFQDLKGSDLVFTGSQEFDERVIGKQPLYFDHMSSYNRSTALFATTPFKPYTFQRKFDLNGIFLGDNSDMSSYIFNTYIYEGMFDYNFADVGQNGRQNFWMKTEYNLRLYQPLEKQVVSGRI